MFGAFSAGALVSALGLVQVSAPAGRLARFQDVQTHPDFRRLGLASSLVWHAARYGLDELGARTLVMVADPGYPAIRLYRRLGFRLTEEQIGYCRG